MMKRAVCFSLLSCLSMGVMVGCHAPSADAMKQPARPNQMDYLAPMIGTWKAEMEMTMAGSDEVMKSTGTNEISWGMNKRYMIEHMTMDMGDGEKMQGLGVWTWDPKAKKFRTWWFDDWSGSGVGSAKYDPDTRTFCFKGKSKNLAMGFSTVGNGCMAFTDDDTMNWCWKERIPWTPFTIFKMCGTSKRQ